MVFVGAVRGPVCDTQGLQPLASIFRFIRPVIRPAIRSVGVNRFLVTHHQAIRRYALVDFCRGQHGLADQSRTSVHSGVHLIAKI